MYGIHAKMEETVKTSFLYSCIMSCIAHTRARSLVHPSPHPQARGRALKHAPTLSVT